jgi:hypothetical protein
MKKKPVQRHSGQPLWVVVIAVMCMVGIGYLLTIPSGDTGPGKHGFFGNLDK